MKWKEAIIARHSGHTGPFEIQPTTDPIKLVFGVKSVKVCAWLKCKFARLGNEKNLFRLLNSFLLRQCLLSPMSFPFLGLEGPSPL